ncbi:unnamed protein product [Lampetra fluviatilis]
MLMDYRVPSNQVKELVILVLCQKKVSSLIRVVLLGCMELWGHFQVLLIQVLCQKKVLSLIRVVLLGCMELWGHFQVLLIQVHKLSQQEGFL